MKPELLTRPSELVLSAIYNLDHEHGSTSEEIVHYISYNYGISSDEMEKKVEGALKRGLSFGLVTRDAGGLYKLKDMNEFSEEPSMEKIERKPKVERPERKLSKKSDEFAKKRKTNLNFDRPKRGRMEKTRRLSR